MPMVTQLISYRTNGKERIAAEDRFKKPGRGISGVCP